MRRNKFRKEDWKLVEDSDGSLEEPDSADEAATKKNGSKNGSKKMSKKKKGRGKSTSSTMSSNEINGI